MRVVENVSLSVGEVLVVLDAEEVDRAIRELVKARGYHARMVRLDGDGAVVTATPPDGMIAMKEAG